MDQQRAIIVAISGCSSSGKTTLARLLRDMFPEAFILHQDDFFKPESELPIKDGLVDWDCPEAISFPDLEVALNHVRKTGTFPVSTQSTTTPSTSSVKLSHRSDHGCPPFPPSNHPLSPPFSPHLPPPGLPSLSANSLTSPPASGAHPDQQPTVDSKEDLNSVGPCPATPAQIARCAAKVRHWLSPGQPGSQIFRSLSSSSSSTSSPSPSSPPPNNSNDHNPNLRLCILDGFLLYTPTAAPTTTTTTTTTTPSPSPPLPSPSFAPLTRIAPLLDIKLFLLATRASALRRRAARDGYITLEGFWKDPPGYVEKIVWPNYVAAHRWLFQGGSGGAGGGGDDEERNGGGEQGDGRRKAKKEEEEEQEQQERNVERGIGLDEEVLRREGIHAPVKRARKGEDGEEGDVEMEFGEVLEWAVDVVMRELERIVLGREAKEDEVRGT